MVDLIKDRIKSINFNKAIDLFSNIEDKWYIFKNFFLILLIPLHQLKDNNLPWVDTELRNWFCYQDNLLVFALSVNENRTGPEWDEYRKIRNYCKSLFKQKMCKFFEDQTLSSGHRGIFGTYISVLFKQRNPRAQHH